MKLTLLFWCYTYLSSHCVIPYTSSSYTLQVNKLNALGYCPLLFVGRHGRKGEFNGDMVHHIPVNDEVVREILKKMGKLYDHLLKSKIILVQNDYIILFYPIVYCLIGAVSLHSSNINILQYILSIHLYIGMGASNRFEDKQGKKWYSVDCKGATCFFPCV